MPEHFDIGVGDFIFTSYPIIPSYPHITTLIGWNLQMLKAVLTIAYINFYRESFLGFHSKYTKLQGAFPPYLQCKIEPGRDIFHIVIPISNVNTTYQRI